MSKLPDMAAAYPPMGQRLGNCLTHSLSDWRSRLHSKTANVANTRTYTCLYNVPALLVVVSIQLE